MILVTGYQPYKEEMNASGDLIESLMESLPQSLEHLRDQLAFATLSVDTQSRESESQSLQAKLDALITQYQPKCCIFTGQAPIFNRITIEKVGLNTFMEQSIDADLPVAYWSNLPGMKGLKEALEDNGIPADYSYYAGQSLCNHILYSSLQRQQKAAFIHIPLLPKQISGKHKERPSMGLETTRAALAVIINHTWQAL